MAVMPNSAAALGGMSTAQPGSASKKSGSASGKRPGSAAAPSANIEELPDATLIFEGNEMMDLEKALDMFAALVQPPHGVPTEFGGATGASLNSTGGRRTDLDMGAGLGFGREPSLNLQAMLTAGEPPGSRGGDREPVILRPLFCRFLLGGKICGADSGGFSGKKSNYKYHECMTLFDSHAMRFGALVGMPRSSVVRVICGIIAPTPVAPAPVPAVGAMGLTMELGASIASVAMPESKETAPRSQQVLHFLNESLPRALAHATVRRRWLDERASQTVPLELEEEEEPTEDEPWGDQKVSIWPPLPPRSVAQKDLPNWMSGVRQWEEELTKQNSTRLLALRSHTESVIRGELLSGQLLEPEVLHFTTRFRPLFERLFLEYADWAAPDPAEVADRWCPRPKEAKEETQDLVAVAAAAAAAATTGQQGRRGTFTASMANHRASTSAASNQLGNANGRRASNGGAMWQAAAAAAKAAEEKSKAEAAAKLAAMAAVADEVGKPRGKNSKDSRGRTCSKGSRTSRPSSATRLFPKQRGHMSFSAFFRFCVDFGLFPKHASFDEIKQIYCDAESILALPQKPTEEKAELEENHCPTPPQQPAKEKVGGRGRPGSGQPEPAAKAAPGKAEKAGAKEGASNPVLDREEAKKAAAKEGVRKRAQRVAENAAAAAAALMAAEEAKTRLDLRFMDKQVSAMTMFEIKTVMYLVAVDEWLSERFVRLPELGEHWKSSDDWEGEEGEKAVEKDGEKAAGESVVPRMDRRSSVARMNTTGVVAGAGGVAELVAKKEGGSKDDSTGGEKEDATGGKKGKPEVQPPSIAKVTAARFLEICRSMGALNRAPLMEEIDLERMFKMLLGSNASSFSIAEPGPLQISVFQLDKALRRAREAKEHLQGQCCGLLCPEREQTAAEVVCSRFFEAIDRQVLERGRFPGADFPGAEPEDIFSAHDELTPQQLIQCASRIGIAEELLPTPQDLLAVLIPLGGSKSKGTMPRSLIYRTLAIVQENVRARRHAAVKVHLQCLAHAKHGGPTTHIFGLPAFVECLLKLALHKLGNKGLSELQRCSPSWWKCTWLLTLLSGHFTEQMNIHKHEQRIRGFADRSANRPSLDSSSESDLDSSGSSAPPTPKRQQRENQLSPSAASAKSFVRRSLSPPQDTPVVRKHTGDEESHGTAAVRHSRSPGREGATTGKSTRSMQTIVRSGSSSAHLGGVISPGRASTSSPATRQTGPASPTSGGADLDGSLDRGDSPQNTTRKSTAVRRHTVTASDFISGSGPGSIGGGGGGGAAAGEGMVSLRSYCEEPKEAGLGASSLRKAQDLNSWWARMHTPKHLPQYLQPLERLVTFSPELFHHVSAEARWPACIADAKNVVSICLACKEQRSPSGWGSPGCVECGGVEELCLPAEDHILGPLLRAGATEALFLSERQDKSPRSSDSESEDDY